MAKPKYEKWLEPEGLAKIEMWARQGLTHADIAANMQIARTTLEVWKKDHPDILEAIKKGNETADQRVENALYKRACGYDVTEDEYRRVKDPKTGEEKLLLCNRKVRHVPADTTAGIFWLKNRKPLHWRDRPAEAAADTSVRVVFDVDEEDEEQ